MVLAVRYPIHLGLAYLLLGGYLASRLFRALKLPAAVGIIANGFLFSHFIQLDLLQGRDHLQALSFFLVLLTAGFEIQLDDLRRETFVFAFVPVTLELVGIAAMAQVMLQYSLVESLVLGATLSCLGDGLVIPKMIEFKSRYESLPMPRLVFTAAPLEASYVLTIYGVLAGLAEAERQEAAGVWSIVFANLLRIAVTLLCGGAVGFYAGRFIRCGRGHHRWLPSHWPMLLAEGSRLKESYDVWMHHYYRKPKDFFCQNDVEAYLMILCVALLGFGVGSMTLASLLPALTGVLPEVFSQGELFQPELLVIVIGACFAHALEQLPQEVVIHEPGWKDRLAEEILGRKDICTVRDVAGQVLLPDETGEYDVTSKDFPLEVRFSVSIDFAAGWEEKLRAACDGEDFEAVHSASRRNLSAKGGRLDPAPPQADFPLEVIFSAGESVLERVLYIVAGVWTFGQLVLFSMLGSRLDINVFKEFFRVLPLLVVGQALRFLGVLASTVLVLRLGWRKYCDCDNPACRDAAEKTWLPDSLFCFISASPRATIQGALGPVPLAKGFFPMEPAARGQEIRLFIATASRLYVLICAVVGSILLDRFGPELLEKADVPRCATFYEEEVREARKSMCAVGTFAPGAGGGAASDDDEEEEEEDQGGDEAVAGERDAAALASEEVDDTLEHPSGQYPDPPAPSSSARGSEARGVRTSEENEPEAPQREVEERERVPSGVRFSDAQTELLPRASFGQDRPVKRRAGKAQTVLPKDQRLFQDLAKSKEHQQHRRQTVAQGLPAGARRQSVIAGIDCRPLAEARPSAARSSRPKARSALHSLDEPHMASQEEEGETWTGGSAQDPKNLLPQLHPQILASQTQRPGRGARGSGPNPYRPLEQESSGALDSEANQEP